MNWNLVWFYSLFFLLTASTLLLWRLWRKDEPERPRRGNGIKCVDCDAVIRDGQPPYGLSRCNACAKQFHERYYQ